jgi:hypothetical protein
MSEETGVAVRRRGRAEIQRLVDLYRSSGMERIEFCRSHEMSLSTLNRNLKKQQKEQSRIVRKDVERSRLVAVELGATVSAIADGKLSGALTVLLANGRRVDVCRDFDGETLTRLLTVLERL